MMSTTFEVGRGDYGLPRLTIELTNICNLHCGYCLRDDEALYRSPANYFSLELLRRVLPAARESAGVRQINFTGGEPTLHPRFSEILELLHAEGFECSFVTNGWNFEKLWPSVIRYRQSLSHIAFSLDGLTREEHDSWRGSGSFVRLIKAFSRCSKAKLPFVIKVGIRRDLIPQLEQIAIFSARMGASGLSFSHLMPTSSPMEDLFSLTLAERQIAEQEIAALARIFKMNIGINVGYYNTDNRAPCSPLAGTSCNIDYQGRLTLCCNLSGYRGSGKEADVVADLNVESFATAHRRLNELSAMQMKRRAEAIKLATNYGRTADLFIGSPCLFCLQSFEKIPWHAQSGIEADSTRSEPLVNIVSAHSSAS